MEYLAPVGPVYQAGTLSANPLAMVGGLAGLRQLTPDTYAQIRKNTERIVALFERWLQEYRGGIFSHYRIVSLESLFWFLPGRPVQRACDIPANLEEEFFKLFKVLLEKGIYLSPNAYEVGFVSLAHHQKVAEDLETKLFS